MSKYVDVDVYIGKKRIRMTGIIVAAVLIFVLFCIAVIVCLPGRGIATVASGRKMIVNDRYIIHAAGAVTDEQGRELTYTNSVEALDNCYGNGNRICELDFMETSDDEVVCAHDYEEEDENGWAHGFAGLGDAVNPPTLEGFMSAKFEGTLTPMSLKDLAQFMNDHSDLYVVTDVKDNNERICRIIKEEYPKLVNNFIIQIYHEDEYDKVKKLGFNNIIYTLYRATDEELETDRLLGFVRDSNLTAVTFWEDYPTQYTDAFEELKTCGIPLCVHTVNDPDRMKSYIDMGIAGIYTDVVNPEDRYQ